MPYFAQMRVFKPVLTTAVACNRPFFVDAVMASDVPLTDASRDVPPLPSVSEWLDQPGEGCLSEAAAGNAMPIEPEIVLEPRHAQALQEDIDSQMAAARDFAALLASEIIGSAGESLRAAARLGSQRVVALLTWTSCAVGGTRPQRD